MDQNPSKPVIGVLGGPGAGKSYVAQRLAGLGGLAIDADALGRGALEASEVRGALAERWGQAVVGPEGTIDRSAVGRIVFSSPEDRAWLEGLVHPRVRAGRAALHERARTDESVRFVVEDSPLLLESGLAESCDVLVFVDASREVRLARVAERGWDAAELDRRESAQASLDTKRRAADYVVRNDGDEPALAASLSEMLRRALSPTDSPPRQAGSAF
ncbi:MAG: dephospho-CoA kinase [Planctomycetota bacterium]